MESELPTRSFKVRGATYSLALNLIRREIREVTAASTGNHGAAVAYAARMLNVPATIFLPVKPNPMKGKRIAALGAKIVEFGRDLPETYKQALAYSEQEGMFLLDDASDPDLPAGTAIIGCEILEQEPSTQIIYVPVGDSALIRGVALAAKMLRPDVKIVGVQAEQVPSYFLSWRSGTPVDTETCATIADGLATRKPRGSNVDAIRKLVDDMRLVSEKQMLAAIKRLLFEELVLAEPAGAAATAALLTEDSGGISPAVALITGANISEDVLRAAVAE